MKTRFLALCFVVLVLLASLACEAAPALPTASPTAVATAPTNPSSSPLPPAAIATPAKESAATTTPLPTRTAFPTSAPASPTPMPTPTPIPVIVPSPDQTAAEALAAERPLRDLADLAIRLKGVPTTAATPIASGNASNYQIGHQDTFWISDQKSKTFFEITATIRFVSAHAYFYVQEGERVSDAALRQAADAFEAKSYPLVRRYFGHERPGLDGDPRMTVLNARIPNVGGYYSSDDQYPESISPHSNERNIVYINISAYPVGTRSYHATLAHEFQHLVSWNVYRAADTWYNEGSSELAMRLTGFDSGGAETAYANDPNTQLTAWSVDDQKNGAHYGAGYLFLSYFAQRFGGPDSLPELFATPGRGTVPFDSYLKKKGYTNTFDDVFRDWVVANYLDDPRIADGRYHHKDLDINARAERLSNYPIQRSVEIEQYAAQYYELSPAPGDVTISITGTTTSRLLDNSPKSGKMQWWSNRGDLMDTTLTRSVDLSGLSKATLQFSTWYDIEEGFDYAYVEASIDGRTWRTLPGRYTTNEDPIGHNFQNGYTGKSGGGNQATWQDENIDLAAYVGKKIWIRFEHVTDDALNMPGFAVDDIAIPELGFRDDGEVSDNGWQARGFVRTANIIPQRYSIRAINVGDTEEVEDVALDTNNVGSFTTQGLGKDYRRVVLVVAPMAPVTTEPAQVQFAVTPKP